MVRIERQINSVFFDIGLVGHNLKKNFVKKKLRDGKASVGAWIKIGSLEVAEILGSIGFDWFVFDMEHGLCNLEKVQNMMQAMSASPTLPMVRVPWNDIVMIKRALDIGAYGVIIPWVNTKKDAENAVKACKYPLHKGLRGVGPRRASNYGFDTEYFDLADHEILIGVQIETETAIRNLKDIFSIDGIDVAFIGPMDLSMSLGCFRNFKHPRFIKAIEEVLFHAGKVGVAPGFYCNKDNINHYIEKGFLFNSLGADNDFLIYGCIESAKKIRGWNPLQDTPGARLVKQT